MNRYIQALNQNPRDELWWTANYQGKPVRCYWRRNPSGNVSNRRSMTFGMFREEFVILPDGTRVANLKCITVGTHSVSDVTDIIPV